MPKQHVPIIKHNGLIMARSPIPGDNVPPRTQSRIQRSKMLGLTTTTYYKSSGRLPGSLQILHLLHLFPSYRAQPHDQSQQEEVSRRLHLSHSAMHYLQLIYWMTTDLVLEGTHSRVPTPMSFVFQVSVSGWRWFPLRPNYQCGVSAKVVEQKFGPISVQQISES